MPSFDLVSKLDMGELKNVINQTERQIAGRYDFKGADVRVELKEEILDKYKYYGTKLHLEMASI